MSDLLDAVYRGDRETVDRLLAEDPDLDIFEAAALGLTYRVTELLAADPALATAVAPDGFTALHLAAYFGGPVAVRALLDAGADPNAVAANPMGVRPLHSAVATGGHGDAESVGLLLEAGAEVDARQQGGFTALQAAAHSGNAEIVEVLLAAGADPSLATDEGATAASLAAEAGHSTLVPRLQG